MHQARPPPPPAPPPAVSLPRDQPTEPLVQRRAPLRPAGGAQRDQRPPWSSQGGTPGATSKKSPSVGAVDLAPSKSFSAESRGCKFLVGCRACLGAAGWVTARTSKEFEPVPRAQRQKRLPGPRGRRFFGRCASAVSDLPCLCTPTRPPVVLCADLRQSRDGVSWRTVVVPNLGGTDRSTPRQGRRSDQAHAKGLLDRSSVGLLCTM